MSHMIGVNKCFRIGILLFLFNNQCKISKLNLYLRGFHHLDSIASSQPGCKYLACPLSKRYIFNGGIQDFLRGGSEYRGDF